MASENVGLNCIAWIPESKHLFVTDKLWPKVYEMELMEQSASNPR